ncbi:hypothetical protein D1B33_04455 [Lysinibacillus yapensis]|uniref:Staygreen protein domain-containing protein n=1 Tax=Ureibacillus yapensis TaxID=2304605 RepID=A0A396SGC5_9BACL|nr:staygreen family protein [Lysinibacillus yapensis]RHW40102.1 hypothetical protein D1B33_04455 [Lysinibacillus yapensis]
MAHFDPQKLTIRFISPANPNEPIQGRKYTLTHSDQTGQLFLDIGPNYNYEAINPQMRDEVIAEWQKNESYRLIGKVYVDGNENSVDAAGKRYEIFKRELGTALQAILFGDRSFFSNYPELLDAPILIYFESRFPNFNQLFYYGTPKQYLSQLQLGV